MNRREILRKAALLSPTVVLPACSTVADLALRSQFFIPTAELLSRFNPLFPFQQSYQGLAKLSLSNPVFSMVPDQNKVRIGMTTGVTTGSGLGSLGGLGGLAGLGNLGGLAGLNTGGTCQIACGLRYDQKSRGIYLSQPEVEKLDITGISSSLTTPFQQLVNTFGPKILDQHPIRTLEPSLAASFIDRMVVESTGIALKFGRQS